PRLLNCTVDSLTKQAAVASALEAALSGKAISPAHLPGTGSPSPFQGEVSRSLRRTVRVWLTVRPNGDTGVGMAVPPVSGGAAGVPAISIPSLSVPSAPLSKKDLGTISLLGLPGIV